MTARLDAVKLAQLSEPPQSKPAERLAIICARDVSPKRVDWIWPQWLARGKLHDIIGVAGVGKSTVLIDIVARATRGGPFPPDNDAAVCDPVTVLIAGVEDGLADTIRPRLDAANADLSRVHFVTAPNGTFTVPRDVRELIDKALVLGATWLHIEAMYAVLDEGTNAYSDHEIRRALQSLKDAGEAHGIAVSFIRHPRKSAASAINAGGGSMAFTALARVGWFIGYDPNDHAESQNDRRRVLAVSKSNMAAHPPALAFFVKSDAGALAGHIAWDGVTHITADDMAAPTLPVTPADRVEKPDPRGKERAWIESQLANGARIALNDLKGAARAAGLAWHRVKRAAADAGVSHELTDTFPATSVWFFPSPQLEQLVQLEHPSLHEEMAVPTAPTAPTGPTDDLFDGASDPAEPVRVTLHDGEKFSTTADDPSLLEMADLIARIEPIAA